MICFVVNLRKIIYIILSFIAAAILSVLDRLTFSEAKSAGSFLDGCNVNVLHKIFNCIT